MTWLARLFSVAVDGYNRVNNAIVIHFMIPSSSWSYFISSTMRTVGNALHSSFFTLHFPSSFFHTLKRSIIFTLSLCTEDSCLRLNRLNKWCNYANFVLPELKVSWCVIWNAIIIQTLITFAVSNSSLLTLLWCLLYWILQWIFLMKECSCFKLSDFKFSTKDFFNSK